MFAYYEVSYIIKSGVVHTYGSFRLCDCVNTIVKQGFDATSWQAWKPFTEISFCVSIFVDTVTDSVNDALSAVCIMQEIQNNDYLSLANTLLN